MFDIARSLKIEQFSERTRPKGRRRRIRNEIFLCAYTNQVVCSRIKWVSFMSN